MLQKIQPVNGRLMMGTVVREYGEFYYEKACTEMLEAMDHPKNKVVGESLRRFFPEEYLDLYIAERMILTPEIPTTIGALWTAFGAVVVATTVTKFENEVPRVFEGMAWKTTKSRLPSSNYRRWVMCRYHSRFCEQKEWRHLFQRAASLQDRFDRFKATIDSIEQPSECEILTFPVSSRGEWDGGD